MPPVKSHERVNVADEGWPWLKPPLALAAIWIVAVIVRSIYLLQVRHSPAFDLLMGDAEIYDSWAKQIAAGDWLGNAVFYQAPLYPYFLGACYATFGPNLVVVRVIQLLLGATSCCLLGAAGYRFFSSRVGFLAGIGLALCPAAIFYDGLIQKTVLDNFFVTLLLFLLSRASEKPDRSLEWLGSGASIACLALARENALVLPILIVPWILLAFPRWSWPQRIRWSALLIAGMAILILPVAARNYHVGGGFHLTTSQFGPNLYIGNNPAATGTYIPLRAGHGNALYERRDATELAQHATGRTLSASEVSAFWTRKALAFMREQPGRWLGLMAKKIFLTWNAHEISDTDNQYFAARWSWLLGALTALFHFGVVCPLAACGIALWPERKRISVLYLLLAGYSVSVALFYVFARYRYPLVPILILFAAAGLVTIVQQIGRGEYRPLILPVAVAVTTAVIVNWPTGLPSEDATTLYNIGLGQLKLGHLSEADYYSQQALQVDPSHWGAHNTLGRVLAADGKPELAATEFRAALTSAPASAELHNNLGNTFTVLHRLADAEREFREAIRLDSGSSSACNGLGVVLAQQGKLTEALEQFRRAIELKPDYEEAKRNHKLVSEMSRTR